MSFTGLGRSVLGETVPLVWVPTSSTISPNTDLPAGDKDICIYHTLKLLATHVVFTLASLDQMAYKPQL